MLAAPAAFAQSETPPAQASGDTQSPYPMTAEGAAAFVAAAEKDLFDYTVEASQVNWVNNTFITEDTDAMAARINAVGTEKSVAYALDCLVEALGP